MSHRQLPGCICSGWWEADHVQGAALDACRQYVYFSFTDILVKATLDGQIVGTVTGLVGHMGCLAYCPQDGRLYASLEYKRDQIGRSILERLGQQSLETDGFYIAIFDVEKINRLGMDAERDGIMTCVHLSEVLADYEARWVDSNGQSRSHRYGCSGIDGLTFAPVFGQRGEKDFLYVAYGIYSDLSREDNDCQVLLRYDIRSWRQYERPLRQGSLHRSGPSRPEEKIFLHTGNTTYGIQNLEYDSYTGTLLAAVYPGKKAQYPNHSFFTFDLTRPLQKKETEEPEGMCQSGRELDDPGIAGWESSLGATGLIALGDGSYYLSEPSQQGKKYSSRLLLHRWTGRQPCPFAPQ